MQDVIRQLLDSVKQDVMLVDAIYQWAVTPTGTTAVNKGHTPYHAFIEQNLKIRYNLSNEDAVEVFGKARKTIEGLGIDFERGFIDMEPAVKGFFEDKPLLLNRTLECFSELPEEKKGDVNLVDVVRRSLRCDLRNLYSWFKKHICTLKN